MSASLSVPPSACNIATDGDPRETFVVLAARACSPDDAVVLLRDEFSCSRPAVRQLAQRVLHGAQARHGALGVSVQVFDAEGCPVVQFGGAQ